MYASALKSSFSAASRNAVYALPVAHAKEVKLYRLNGGEKARMTQDGLTVTAKYPGKRGNDICIKIAENVDESDCWDV